MIAKNALQFLVIIVFAIVAGLSLSYLAEIPITPEIEAYKEIFNQSDVVTDNFEQLDKYQAEAFESIKNSNYSNQRLFLDIFFVPLSTFMFAVGWYFLGLYAQNDGYLKWLKIAVAAVALVYFGYFYQPYLNAIGYILGVFGVFEKLRNRVKQS